MTDRSKTLASGSAPVAHKRWLREASMKRLNMLIKNKKESIGEDFLCSDISADDLESSGLSAVDRFHLNKWADGFESGRHCMLALLENRAAAESDMVKNLNGKGVIIGAPQQRPLEMAMLSATISLPDEFLCDSGFLYDSIFSRAPGAVVREAMQLLAAKAFEKTSATLRIDQINLALKQLRVEKLTANVTSASSSGKESDEKRKKSVVKVELEVESDTCDKDKENHSNGLSCSSSRGSPAFSTADTATSTAAEAGKSASSASSSSGVFDRPEGEGDTVVKQEREKDSKKSAVTQTQSNTQPSAPAIDRELELFRLQIVTELIKMHITAGKKITSSSSVAVSVLEAAVDPKVKSPVAIPPSSPTATARRNSLPSSPSATAKAVTSSRVVNPKESQSQKDSEREKEKERGDGKKGCMDVDTIEQHLDSSLLAVEAIAEAQDPVDLEESNIRLKPYLKQLNALKASLSAQLRELEDSRAFIALGISKEATEAMIKKAYHSKAIKLHPDKPGGDTAKFQQLQASYQEILKKKAEAVATEKEMNGDDDDEDESDGMEERMKKKCAAEDEKERVNAVLSGLGEVLEQVKGAADHCTRIGQLAIKWQKRIDKASRLPYPDDLNQLYKIIKETESKKKKGDRERDRERERERREEGEDSFVLECSAKLAIGPLEKICELMQLLSSLAMELPSCGFRYGLAIAGNSNYMKVVESAMSSGLDAIKSVGALLSAEQQLNSCLNRIKEAKKYIFDFDKGDKDREARTENEGKKEVRTILVQMILSAFRGNSATVGIAAERAVNAVFIASELYGIASGVVQQASEDRKSEAKKSVARKEEEREMCHEDRELLKEKKAQERDEDTKRFLAEEKKREEERRKEKEEEGSDSLEKLRLKIKSLQVQLRVQNVQTLQSLNGETKALQRKLQQQLKELMLLTLADGEFFASNAATPLPPAPPSSSSSSGGGSGSGSGAVPLPPFRASLLSLLADFIDSSCNELRADLQDIGAGSGAGAQTQGGSVSGVLSDTDSDSSYELVSALHLGDDDGAPDCAAPTSTSAGAEGRSDSCTRASRYGRISASIEVHLGWMRDLRGEKPCTRCPSPPHTEADAETETEAEADRSSQPGTAEDTPQDDGSVGPDDEGVWQASRDSTAAAAPPPAPTREEVEEKEGDKMDENEGEIKAEKDKDKEREKEEESTASSEPKGEEPSPPEATREEGSVSSGVRLALLPDFRSKILWLAALVDVEGVIVIVKEELHGRLKEIVEAAYAQSDAMSGPSLSSPSLPSPTPSSSSTDGSCDSFCSLVIRGIKSAAAPLSEVK